MPRFPRAEAPFFGFVKTVVGYLTTAANATRLDIAAARQTALTSALATYTTAYNKADDRNNRTKMDVLNRNNARHVLEDVIRLAYGDIAPNDLTDLDRSVLNIPLRNSPTPAPTPTSHPVVTVNTSNRLQHILSIMDYATGKKAKPKGVKGCEIWYFIGGAAAPTDQRLYRLLTLSEKSSYTVNFDIADAGKPVWYILRWANSRGETGPWSAVVMATIGG